MNVHVEATYGATKKFIAAGLESFNRQHMTRSPPKSFALTAREGGKARGGLMAEGVGEWIVVSLLWIEDGFGVADTEALCFGRQRQKPKSEVQKAFWSTLSPSRPRPYKKHGYAVYGQVDDFPEAGMIWHRFKKAL